MKKIMYAGVIMLGVISMAACDQTDRRSGTTEHEGKVVDRDTVATEYEVKETVVDYDTTTHTKTVKPEDKKDKN